MERRSADRIGSERVLLGRGGCLDNTFLRTGNFNWDTEGDQMKHREAF